MTIRELLTATLWERGMSRSEADAAIVKVEADEKYASMRGLWDEDLSGYPPQTIAVLLTIVEDRTEQSA